MDLGTDCSMKAITKTSQAGLLCLEQPVQYICEMMQWGSVQQVALRAESTAPAEIKKRKQDLARKVKAT